MISAATIAALEERALEYVLGTRERTDILIRTVVLADTRAFTPLCVRRTGGEQTQFFVEEVKVEGRRYTTRRGTSACSGLPRASRAIAGAITSVGSVADARRSGFRRRSSGTCVTGASDLTDRS